jgi:hypothetical protein
MKKNIIKNFILAIGVLSLQVSSFCAQSASDAVHSTMSCESLQEAKRRIAREVPNLDSVQEQLAIQNARNYDRWIQEKKCPATKK